MSPAIWLCCFLPLIVMLITEEREKKIHIKQKIISRKKKERAYMTEIVKNYIGKECMIYTMNSQLLGVIKAVEGGWMSIDNGKEVEAVNLDYVVRVREHPKGKSGKKKALTLD